MPDSREQQASVRIQRLGRGRSTGLAQIKLLAVGCLGLVGFFSMAAAVLCAFATFATNDYQPIILSGFGFASLALLCFAVLIWWDRAGTLAYVLIGVLPCVGALAELVRRA